MAIIEPPPIAGFKSPGLSRYLQDLETRPLAAAIEEMLTLLGRGQLSGSRQTAIATLSLLSHAISENDWKSTSMLLDVLSHLGRRLTRARPRDMVIANVVRRVLALVRSEDAEAQAAREGGLNGSPSDQAQDTCSATQSPKRAGHELERNGAPQLGGRADAGEPSFFKSSMLDLFSAEEQLDNTTPVSSQARPPKGDDAKLDGLREDILDGLQELQDEVKQAEEQIAEYAPQYIHNRAVVLVNQTSRVAQRFLVAAAKKAKFTAIFVESSSRYHYRGAPASSHPSSSVPPDTMSRQEFLAPLKKVGISVSVVSLTSLPPILKWCTHLITVPSIVFADGSYLGPAGLDMLVGAAQDHDILVLMLSAVYMIAPLTQLNYEGLLSPDRSNLSSWYEDTDLLGSSSGIKLRAVDDEHVRPNPSTLLITNLGGGTISSLSILVEEHYHLQDPRYRVDLVESSRMLGSIPSAV